MEYSSVSDFHVRYNDGLWSPDCEPQELLLGAAAQFGIYAAYFMAIAFGFNDKAAAAISIIGGADGPTSIFLAGKLGQTEFMGPIAVAAYSYMALAPLSSRRL